MKGGIVLGIVYETIKILALAIGIVMLTTTIFLFVMWFLIIKSEGD